jgi:hypothetical protein
VPAANQFEITPGSHSDQINGGPFAIGGNLYVVSWDIPGTAHVFVSADGGSTWAELDSVHAPVNAHSPANAVFDGAITLWVMTTSVGGVIFFTPFDTLAKTWGSPTTTLNVNSFVGVSQLGFRSDTTIIVLSEHTIPQETQFFVFDSTTLASTAWSSCGATGAGVSCFSYGMFQGLSGVWWFVYIVASGGAQSLVIQSVSLSNTLGSLVTVDSSGTFASSSFGGQQYSDGTKVVLAWQPIQSSQQIVTWKAPLLTMVFSTQIVTVPASDPVNQWALTGSETAGVFLFVVAGDLLQFIDVGAGFGSGATLLSAVNFQTIIAGMIAASTSGWALVVDSNPPLYFIIPGIVVLLPSSIGSLCKYGRRVRCQRAPKRTIISTGPLVFGGGR